MCDALFDAGAYVYAFARPACALVSFSMTSFLLHYTLVCSVESAQSRECGGFGVGNKGATPAP